MADTAKVFMSGRSQAVRLPKAYRVDAAEMTIERVGDTLVLRPVRPDALERFLQQRDAHLAAHPDDVFPDRDQAEWDDGAVDKAFR
ncbi:antitoxin [Rubrimonas cliftonensis]|uniref:Antitoxin VapB n=1 Tax=Rubrimonas cliftonensis TaxID=89524 RepID=A0A1H4FIZ0_9RHOB|nr:AbrB/MazE/SpoVT family DNA-binding domain-containing protein [Rubrimonas cliftonensis]SEA96452.1 antitoxin VapB [Rubrimonas cliftonensis]